MSASKVYLLAKRIKIVIIFIGLPGGSYDKNLWLGKKLLIVNTDLIDILPPRVVGLDIWNLKKTVWNCKHSTSLLV